MNSTMRLRQICSRTSTVHAFKSVQIFRKLLRRGKHVLLQQFTVHVWYPKVCTSILRNRGGNPVKYANMTVSIQLNNIIARDIFQLKLRGGWWKTCGLLSKSTIIFIRILSDGIYNLLPEDVIEGLRNQVLAKDQPLGKLFNVKYWNIKTVDELPTFDMIQGCIGCLWKLPLVSSYRVVQHLAPVCF